jgi:signal transduction histidine kinase
MRSLDLRGRVTLASALALAAGLAVLTIGINLLISHQLDADASTVLRERANAELATLEFGPHGAIIAHDAPNDAALDRYGWVFARDGRAVEHPPTTPEVQRAAAALAGTTRPVDRDVGDRVRLRAMPAYDAAGRRSGAVVVGESLTPYAQSQRVVLVATLAIGVFVLAAGTLLVRRAVDKALRPVADMTERAADWSEHDLERRFNLGPPRDELTALSATLDGLLARLGSSLRHEQRFSAEVAHELRTPLAGIRGEAELALAEPSVGGRTRDAFEQILRGTERMQSVIETLVAAARRDARGVPGSCDAAIAADAAADAVRPIAERTGVRLELRARPNVVLVGADEDLVAQALKPLIDNAVRHAGAAVTVTVGRADGEAVFTVADDGPGFGPDAGAPFEPGNSTAGGAGLGLPLARRLARSCGGDVKAEPDATGGCFELRLPALL